MRAKEAVELGRRHAVVLVDLKFVDLVGRWRRLVVPFSRLTEASFEEGFGLEGSVAVGLHPSGQSDLVLVPDPSTAILEPFVAHPILSLECRVEDAITRQSFPTDPRYVVQRAEAYLRSTGLADTCRVGVQSEFAVLAEVRHEVSDHRAHFGAELVVDAGRSRGAGGPAGALRPESLRDLQSRVIMGLSEVGLTTLSSHLDSARATLRLDIAHETIARQADRVLWLKHVARSVVGAAGYAATFMPKPLREHPGLGMSVNLSLWRGDRPLFAGDGYGGMSEMGLSFVAGILKHARSLCALTNPSLNSYRRLIPGFDAPANLAYSTRNRSAAVRIPTSALSPARRRVEARFPDATANPQLAFAALLMAGLDGIRQRLDPGDPLDKDVYSLSPEELRDVPCVPASLEDALDALEADHDYLLAGDVFTRDLIEIWLDQRREHDVAEARRSPTPLEYALYFDA